MHWFLNFYDLNIQIQVTMNRFALLLVILTSCFFNSLQAAETLATNKYTYTDNGGVENISIQFPKDYSVSDATEWEAEAFSEIYCFDGDKLYELDYISSKEKQSKIYVTVDGYGCSSHPETVKTDLIAWVDFSSKSQEEIVQEVYILRSLFLQVYPGLLAEELEIPVNNIFSKLNLIQKDDLQMVEMNIDLSTPVVIDDEVMSSIHETIVISKKNIYFLTTYETSLQEHRNFVNSFNVK